MDDFVMRPMDDFVLRALLGGIGVAVVAGPLGAFVVWRRMAYFGSAISHSALLGVALGLLFGFDTTVGVIAVCVGLAALIVLMQRQRQLTDDTLLGILSHGTLAIGLVALAFLDRVRVDLMGYLFGDILAVSAGDLWWSLGGGVATLAVLAAIWRPLLSATVHEELARVEGEPVAVSRAVYMLLLALYIAVAMKVVGVLLITSLLVIPAATARRFATTPESMAGIAALFGATAVMIGLAGSFSVDTPSGPSIVVAALALFGVSLLVRRRPG
ncbi:MAG: metal ABC transporter permease [Alphaproteobacteria bacterium]